MKANDSRRSSSPGWDWAWAAAIVAAVTGVAWLAFDPPHMTDAVMLYQLGVLVASLRLGRGPSLLAALVSVVLFDFIFIPPRLSFLISDMRHFVTFLVMLLVALVINRLARSAREQAEAARVRERRTTTLYELGCALDRATDRDSLVAAAARSIADAVHAEVAVFTPEAADLADAGTVHLVYRTSHAPACTGTEAAAAQWCWVHRREAGCGALAFPQAAGLYLHVSTAHGRWGVIGVFLDNPRRMAEPGERTFLDGMVTHFGAALERTLLAEKAEESRISAESERLRNALLSSVSHDLRTPLGAIEGAASALLALGGSLDEPTRRELVETVHEEAQRLGRRVSNLLDMTRLEAGGGSLRREWQPLEEVVGSTLAQLDRVLTGRAVRTELPSSLPPVLIDSVVLGQALINILENAVKYSPPGTPLDVSAERLAKDVVLSISDRGMGIPSGEETRIFERFHRAEADRGTGGVGLGLAICRAIVDAHGGRIWAENRPGGGAVFRLTVPAGEDPAESTE